MWHSGAWFSAAALWGLRPRQARRIFVQEAGVLPVVRRSVLQVVQRVLSRHLLEQAGLKAGEGDCG